MAEPQQFQNWVTQDVLTAIRKDGMYVQGEEGIAKGEMTAQAALPMPTSGRGGDLVSYMEPQVFLKDGQVFANSRDVAEYFGKAHKNVLADIEERRKTLSAGISAQWYMATTTAVKVGFGIRKDLAYDMDREGFTYLVMKWEGTKAAEFQVNYIMRFKEMEGYIKGQQQPAPIALPQTYGDALRALADKHERNLLLEQDIQEERAAKNQLHEQVVELEGEIEEARDSYHQRQPTRYI